VPESSSQVSQSVPSGRCGPGWSMLRPKTETYGPEWKPRQVAGLVAGSAACKVFRLSQSVISAVGFAQSGKLGNSVFLSAHEVGCKGAVNLGWAATSHAACCAHQAQTEARSNPWFSGQRWPFSRTDPERGRQP
jgi:hypothetical protein